MGFRIFRLDMYIYRQELLPVIVGGDIFSRFPLKIEISKVAGAIFPNSKGVRGDR